MYRQNLLSIFFNPVWYRETSKGGLGNDLRLVPTDWRLRKDTFMVKLSELRIKIVVSAARLDRYIFAERGGEHIAEIFFYF